MTQLLLLFAAQALQLAPTTELRARQLSRLLGSIDDDNETALRRPAGSTIEVSKTDAGTLVIKVPPQAPRDWSKLAFATTWCGVVAVWTAGAIASAPIFAAFSVPFWMAGARLLRETYVAATVVTIGEYAFEINNISGSTADLDEAKVVVDAWVNGEPVTTLRLVEGITEHVVAIGLARKEQDWLVGIINDSLRDLKTAALPPPPP